MAPAVGTQTVTLVLSPLPTRDGNDPVAWDQRSVLSTLHPERGVACYRMTTPTTVARCAGE